MRTKTSKVLDASVGSSTENFEIFGGPMSIQPVATDITGNPSYTLEISNDGINFCDYTRESSNLKTTSAIEILSNHIPWRYVRLTVTPDLSTGSIYFIVSQGEKFRFKGS